MSGRIVCAHNGKPCLTSCVAPCRARSVPLYAHEDGKLHAEPEVPEWARENPKVKRTRRQTLALCAFLLDSWGERVTPRTVRALWPTVRAGQLGIGDVGPFGGMQ